MSVNNDLPTIPCPVCESCDHDLRGGILELVENIGQNLKDAAEELLTACEARGTGAPEFIHALASFGSVRHQITMTMEVIPELADVKARATE